MLPDDIIRIRHMAEACQTLQSFVTGRTIHDLEADQMLLFAVVRAIEVVGEAASKVSMESRRATPGIP